MIKSVEIVLTTHYMIRQRRHTRLNPCSLQSAVARRHEKVGRPSRSVPCRWLSQTSITLMSSQREARAKHWWSPSPSQGHTTLKTKPGPSTTQSESLFHYRRDWGRSQPAQELLSYQPRLKNPLPLIPLRFLLTWAWPFLVHVPTQLLMRSASPWVNWATEKHPWESAAYAGSSFIFLGSKRAGTFNFSRNWASLC